MKIRVGAVIAVAAVAGCSAAKYVRPTTDEKVAVTSERLERGRYLVENVAMCGSCHDGRASGNILDAATPELKLAGGMVLEDSGMKIYIPNITNDPETGIGNWTDDELIRGIRDGVRPDGKFMFPMMPYLTYQYMSDDDVRAVVAYLRSVPPVKQTKPRQEHEVPFFLNWAIGMGVTMHEPVKNVVAPDPSDKPKYGEYLAHLGHCTLCHSMGGAGARAKDDRYMGGSNGPMEVKGVGKVWARNLTMSKTAGLGNYTPEQIKAALISGRRLDGKTMAPPMSMLTPYIALMKPEDMDAIVAFLQSVPPSDKPVPERELTPEYAKLLGE